MKNLIEFIFDKMSKVLTVKYMLLMFIIAIVIYVIQAIVKLFV